MITVDMVFVIIGMWLTAALVDLVLWCRHSRRQHREIERWRLLARERGRTMTVKWIVQCNRMGPTVRFGPFDTMDEAYDFIRTKAPTGGVVPMIDQTQFAEGEPLPIEVWA